MNFDDERFVKIYPRNTTNWKLLGWEGRCVLMMLLREVDRAGCLDQPGDAVPESECRAPTGAALDPPAAGEVRRFRGPLQFVEFVPDIGRSDVF